MALLSRPVAGTIPRAFVGRSLARPNSDAVTTSPTLRSMVLWRGGMEDSFHYQKLVQYFWRIFWTVSCLGLHKFAYGMWAARLGRQGQHCLAPPDDHDSERMVNAATVFLTRLQWKKTVKMMMDVWRSVWVGCALILPLSITLLQIDGVIDNAFARTSALAAIVFSAAGILTSSVFVSGKLDFSCKNMEQRWKEASKCPTPSHILTEFWACLVLPVSSAIWAVVFTIATIVMIAWMKKSEPMSLAGGCSSITYINCDIFASAISVTSLIILNLAQICRAVTVLTRT